MTIKKFLINLLLMALVLALVIIGTLFWLKSYTNHGQQIELPDYVGINYDTAKKDADDKTFKLIVKDSVHRVGVKGGEILNQIPVAYSKVKENRTVYVTTAKYKADLLKLSDLPALYGKYYESKKEELKNFYIESEIKGYKFDTGEPDHILEVWQNGKKIVGKNVKSSGVTVPKGGKLQFVLSEKQGGMTDIPKLRCQPLSVAQFMLSQSLRIGKVSSEGDNAVNKATAIIVAQYPPYSNGGKIEMNSPIDITISNTKPNDCQ